MHDASDYEYDKSVSEAHLEASGWDVGVFNHSNPFESHFLYICDYRSDHNELISVKREDFEKGGIIAPAEDICTLVAKLIKRHQRGRLNKREKRIFLPALLTYVKATQTYSQWCQVAGEGQRLHFVINIYPAKTEGCLRPFILRDTKTVIDAEALIADSEKVRQNDLTRHPEWFS